MRLLLCRSCGEFVMASTVDGRLRPRRDACPGCGGTEFKDTCSGRTIDAQDA